VVPSILIHGELGTKMKRAFVLITDDEEDAWAQELVGILRPLGELKIVQQGDFSAQGLSSMCELVIIDATSVRHISDLVAELRQCNPQRRVVVMTASPRWQSAREAFEAGAQDYLSKNVSSDKVLSNIRAVLEKPVARQG
jgi:DNA-binding NtrC family response regulator